MSARVAIYALWAAAPVVQAFLAVILLRRKLRRNFPIFFVYTVLQAAFFPILITLYHASYIGYFWAYWATSLVGVVLSFVVMREIFTNLLRPYDSLRDLGDVLFRWAAVVLFMVAMVAAASGTMPHVNRITIGVLALERSVRVMQCGLVLFMFLFSSHLGLSSRHHVFGVALGFGIFAAVELTIVTLHAAFGPLNWQGLDLVKSGSYVIATIVWCSYLISPEPERKPVESRVQSDRWNSALFNAQNPMPQDSFMCAVENAVERVLTRREAGPQTRS